MSSTPIIRISLPDGRWLDMHRPNVNQQMAIMDLSEEDSPEANNARTRFYWGVLRESCEQTSWGGDIGDGLSLDDLPDIVTRWMAASENDAVPLGSASDSDTQSPQPQSEAPTAKRRKSSTRRSSKS